MLVGVSFRSAVGPTASTAARAEASKRRAVARRKPNGMLYLLVASAALAHPVSREWKGYWQRHAVL